MPGIDASRLWSEVQRVTTVQYEYGNQADVKAAREAARGMIEGLLREYPKGSGPLYAKYAEVLDVLGARKHRICPIWRGVRAVGIWLASIGLAAWCRRPERIGGQDDVGWIGEGGEGAAA